MYPEMWGRMESTSRERENRYKRGRSKDSKSSLQSEDVMWTEPSRKRVSHVPRKSRYSDTLPVP